MDTLRSLRVYLADSSPKKPNTLNEGGCKIPSVSIRGGRGGGNQPVWLFLIGNRETRRKST